MNLSPECSHARRKSIATPHESLVVSELDAVNSHHDEISKGSIEKAENSVHTSDYEGNVLAEASTAHSESLSSAHPSGQSPGPNKAAVNEPALNRISETVTGESCRGTWPLSENAAGTTCHGPSNRMQVGNCSHYSVCHGGSAFGESHNRPNSATGKPIPPPPNGVPAQTGYSSDPLMELAYFTLLQQQSQASTSTIQPLPAAASEHVSDEETALRRVEGTRSYAECRQLVDVYRHQAPALPSLLVELAMRLALWGSREFKENLHAEFRSMSASQKPHSSTLTPGRTNGGTSRVTDERYEDYRHCMRSLLQDVQKVIDCRRGTLSGSFMVKALRAFGQSRLATMETIRHLAAEAQQRLHQLKPSELVSLLQSYTQGLEVGADALGGINITVNDATFTKLVLQHLVTLQHLLKELTPREITGLLRCCDRLSLQDPQLFKYVGQLALLKRSQFQSSEWASVVGVFTRMGIPLRGECEKTKRPRQERDWERPPPPKKPVPISKC